MRACCASLAAEPYPKQSLLDSPHSLYQFKPSEKVPAILTARSKEPAGAQHGKLHLVKALGFGCRIRAIVQAALRELNMASQMLFEAAARAHVGPAKLQGLLYEHAAGTVIKVLMQVLKVHETADRGSVWRFPCWTVRHYAR